ncbi:hypothetical protein ACPPVT_03175 [Angustibacter sp. McL0619]|uniref:hypothetical protein n=1 Tax=Angustibacter sp. McL0619 TaxID=3415676 RepID=UPI003CE6C02E
MPQQLRTPFEAVSHSETTVRFPPTDRARDPIRLDEPAKAQIAALASAIVPEIVRHASTGGDRVEISIIGYGTRGHSNTAFVGIRRARNVELHLRRSMRAVGEQLALSAELDKLVDRYPIGIQSHGAAAAPETTGETLRERQQAALIRVTWLRFLDPVAVG